MDASGWCASKPRASHPALGLRRLWHKGLLVLNLMLCCQLATCQETLLLRAL